MNIEQRELQEYPYEIAETYRCYTNIKEEDYLSRVLKLEEISQVLVKTLCAVNTRWFLASSIADGNVNAELERFQSPAHGNWKDLFREVCRAISASDSVSPPPLVDAITKFYQAKVPGGAESEVYAAYKKVSEMYGLQLDKKLTSRRLFERLVELRNKFAHGAPQALSPAEREDVANSFHMMLHYLLRGCHFLCSYEVLFIAEVNKKRGGFSYSAKICRGFNINNETLFHPEETSETIEEGELYICSVDRKSSSRPVITWAISLNPYFVLASCTDCKREQVFVFNGRTGTSLVYLSYQCSHYYNHAGLSDEFENIRKLLSGEISRFKVFSGHLLGEALPEERAVLTLQQRLAAERKAIQALQLISESSYEQAQELADQALKEDRDSFQANHALALIYIRYEQLERARKHFEKAIHLSPEHRPSLLGLALVCAELSDLDAADKHLQSLLRVDPTNAEGRSLSLVSLDAVVRISTTVDPIRRQEAADHLVRRIQNAERHRTITIHPYLELLPPWSIVPRLPLPAVISCFLIAAMSYAILALTHIDSWSPIFHFRMGIVGLIIFLGLWYPFAFAKLLRNYFTRLERVALLPTDTFQRWYLAQVAHFFGVANLDEGRGPQPVWDGVGFSVDEPLILRLAKLYPPEHLEKINSLKESYFKTPMALERRLDELTGTKISRAELEACVHSSRSNWRGRQQRIRMGVMSWWSDVRAEWGLIRWVLILTAIGGTLNVLAAHSYFSIKDPTILFFGPFEVYCVVWLIPFFLGSMRLVPEIVKQPVRYHIGLPLSLSLVVLADFYLVLAAFMTPVNVFFFFQHFVWRTHIGATIATVGGFTLSIGAFVIILFGPQFVVAREFGSLKQRKLREYAVSMEKTFNTLLSDSTPEHFKEMQSQNEVMRYITRNLPSTGFSPWSFVAFIVLLLVNLGCFVGYLIAIAQGYWPWLGT
jgi:tetratricopeptide (TPR) repeat protein